ncbi:protein-tyrosine phosphatase-like protein [Cantharellus anzutake]|uniref:protein-tyrosine phosphatase-like protein n=1 Tax=Cantharellus anzutake TaxID=1750568 RepID=UPI001906E0A6|nr:protein-tyrosine phosphatase-like protein [Cantharellus anzutake]KAF8334985.1 protein-tyrosine phosphatase-like protein [Cantharellus anzutake]
MATHGCEPLCMFSDRLYFTTFPCPPPSATLLNRDADRSSPPPLRKQVQPSPSPPDDTPPKYHYFTVDDDLTYLSFFEDWGPLNIAMVYRACIYIHELLEDEMLQSRCLVLYSSDDPRKKANAALLMALYTLIVLRRSPWEAFQPIAELEFMPFRDAGRGRSDFATSIHDCLWGFWKALRNGLINMNDFNVAEYEYYEKVENGDWNWITPGFIAFASPNDPVWIRQQKRQPGQATPTASSFSRKLPQPYQNCLDYFEERNVKLVIRLNNPLYDKVTFEERGMEHLELYFDDGTNPTDQIVREFISRSEAVHEAGGVVAVHCKAGLGRTGTLIGAYLIYKYDFTANEAIAFMRITRPGCVVGPQQQYLYQQQLHWAKWAALDQARKADHANTVITEEPRTITPPLDDKPLPAVPVTPSRPSLNSMNSVAEVEALLPPGQPRKTPTTKRVALEMLEDEEEDCISDSSSQHSVLGNRTPSASATRGAAPVTKQLRSTSPSGKTVVKTTTAIAGSPAKRVHAAPSTARVTRATTRAHGNPSPRKGGVASHTRSATVIAPLNFGPRPTNRMLTATASKGHNASADSPTKLARVTLSKIPSRKLSRAASPPSALPSAVAYVAASLEKGPGMRNSRLPTLVPSKRTFGGKPLPLIQSAVTGIGVVLGTVSEGSVATLKSQEDVWMSNTNVVETGTKTRRPSLRPTRRRRSSFSNADIQ